MSRYIKFLILILTTAHADISVNTTTTWKHVGDYKAEKSSITNTMTFRSRKAFNLKRIKLKWTGIPVKDLAVSLYKKRKEGDKLIPVEENMISDGIWNPKTQEITFKMNEKLVAITRYYFVVSYPRRMEKNLKDGKLIPSANRAFVVASTN